jgi:hypothetical protein|nr:MAG TPA: hypothetical protein [Caudoviricetes sp.]
MRTILINILKKMITDSIELRKKYELRDPTYHIATGRIDACREVLELLKEEKNGSTERI